MTTEANQQGETDRSRNAREMAWVMETFILDRVDNPHPAMRDRALGYRRVARMAAAAGGPSAVLLGVRWLAYLEAMSDATGESPEAIEAWLDRHDHAEIPERQP